MAIVKLLRTVKRLKTVKKIMTSQKDSTIFEVTTYGYRTDGSISSNIIRERKYEVYSGDPTEYPGKLRENQKSILVTKTFSPFLSR